MNDERCHSLPQAISSRSNFEQWTIIVLLLYYFLVLSSADRNSLKRKYFDTLNNRSGSFYSSIKWNLNLFIASLRAKKFSYGNFHNRIEIVREKRQNNHEAVKMIVFHFSAIKLGVIELLLLLVLVLFPTIRNFG